MLKQVEMEGQKAGQALPLVQRVVVVVEAAVVE
jgi:hypothetical protein